MCVNRHDPRCGIEAKHMFAKLHYEYSATKIVEFEKNRAIFGLILCLISLTRVNTSSSEFYIAAAGRRYQPPAPAMLQSET